MDEPVERGLVPLADIDRFLEAAGDNVGEILALDVLADAAKNFTLSHEQKKAAQIAKLKIARKGGRVLRTMAEDHTRSDGGRPRKLIAESDQFPTPRPTLTQLGLTPNRSKRWQDVERMTSESFAARIRAIDNEEPDRDLTGESVRDAGSGDFEWFTPPDYIEAARRVMGGIDLDPASTAAANEVVQAAAYFTARDDGLVQNWQGRVWMNPPYAAKLVWNFCEKLAEDYAAESVTQACVLLNNTTETAWFQRLSEVSSAICLPARRVRFWHPLKPEAESPKQGQAVLYLGPNVKAFCTEFRTFGVTAAFI